MSRANSDEGQAPMQTKKRHVILLQTQWAVHQSRRGAFAMMDVQRNQPRRVAPGGHGFAQKACIALQRGLASLLNAGAGDGAQSNQHSR